MFADTTSNKVMVCLHYKENCPLGQFIYLYNENHIAIFPTVRQLF